MAELSDLVRVLSRDRGLCLPCIAASLSVKPADAERLLQLFGQQVRFKEIVGPCPRCRTGTRLFSLA